MKKIVCFISIIIIIIFIGDYYNSKYARGVFFEHHFISDNVMIFRMGSNTGYYTGYYTYFAKEENSSIDKNILHQLFDHSPASMPIFGMTECTNLGIHDSTIVGYSLLDNKLILDNSLSKEAITITPGILVIVVITNISPENILYISDFLTPIALNIPTSLTLDIKEALIIKYISTKEITGMPTTLLL